ncbi:MAG: wax ester/triacylglycerol synthase domain-containing protein, partial [Myxococcota bacterium]
MEPTDQAPLKWGEARELNAIETLMWRVETDPRFRSPMVLVEVLDRVPDWDRFVASAEWGTRMAPRFRQRLIEPALGLGQPVWVTDPAFDLDYHVRRAALPQGGGIPSLIRAVEQLGMTPFDRARSPWEAVLYEGLPEGRAAFVLKMHHVATDGLGGVQLLGQLHSRQRESDPRKPQPPAPPPERFSNRTMLREQFERDLMAVPRIARDGLTALTRRPRRAFLQRAVAYGASMRRMLADPVVEGSPLLASRSLSFRYCAVDLRFVDLKAAGKAAGGSINDAYIAALLGGMRRYHEAMGHPVAAIPMAMPVSVRRSDDPAGGNRFVGIRCAGPLSIEDPRDRIQAVHGEVKRLRDEPALDALGALAPALSRLPGPLLPAVAGGFTTQNDLQASNVP